MNDLLKEYLKYSLIVSAFLGVSCVWSMVPFFKRTKTVQSKKVRILIRVIVSVALACLWVWFCLCNAYPFALAYYEYNHGLSETRTGRIELVERNGKDCMVLQIDGTKYKMAYSSVSPAFIWGSDFDEGDMVTIKAGEKSHYIFELNKSDNS